MKRLKFMQLILVGSTGISTSRLQSCKPICKMEENIPLKSHSKELKLDEPMLMNNIACITGNLNLCMQLKINL